MTFLYGQFFLGLKLPKNSNTSEETLDNMRRMICSLHVTICLLMSPKNVDGDTIHKHVKIFLSCCHHFVREHYGGGTEEF